MMKLSKKSPKDIETLICGETNPFMTFNRTETLIRFASGKYGDIYYHIHISDDELPRLIARLQEIQRRKTENAP